MASGATSLEHEIVRMLINRKGLGAVLTLTAEICREIAADIAWQDKPASIQWERAAVAVEKCGKAAAIAALSKRG